MYEVIIEYLDRDNNQEIEIETVKSKRAAEKLKDKYEENIYEMQRKYPDIYTIDKIYTRKVAAHINWGFLCIGFLIALILVVLDNTPKCKNIQEIAQAVTEPSTYQTQCMDFEDGVTYEIKLIAVFYCGYGNRDRLNIVFENNGQVKYTSTPVYGSNKTILQASEISKLTIGDIYKITKNGSDIKITK